MPLAYFYGHNSPKSNPQLYQSLVSLMASKIEERMGNDSDVNASGMIIDTYAWSDIGDMETILHCAKAFSIDVILVTDDRLYSSLKPLLENSTVIVVKIPRSGGVVAQDAATRRRRRKAKIDEYFYGKKVEPGKPTTLSPARVNIRLSHYSFVQLGGLQLHEGIKAHGTNTAVDPLQGILLTPSRDNLLQCVVAVLHKEDTSDDTADGASEVKIKYGTGVVAGFLYMVEVDIEKDSAVILAPCPGPLPSKNIVVGSVKWYE
jgi:polyribonucleotide 5'-hydroxyl-kinase